MTSDQKRIRRRKYYPGENAGRLESGGRDWTEIHPESRPPWARRFEASGCELTTVAAPARKR